jgi:VanZ family protein
MSGLLGDPYVRQFSESPSVVATIALIALLGFGLAAAVPRRQLLVGLTGLALAVVLGVTCVPQGGWRNFGLTSGIMDSIRRNVRPERGDLTAWTQYGDGWLNVLLFIPLAFFLALLLRRPVTALVLCGLLSLGIECYQSSLTTRVGAFPDVVANALGAAIGAGAAALVLAGVMAGRWAWAAAARR